MSIEAMLTLIGGPTVLMDVAGVRLLTDPTFDPPGSYEAGGITLTKTTGPALAPTDIGAIDAVLLSHDQHFDNFDRAGRAFLPQAHHVFTTQAGAHRLGGLVTGLAPWQAATITGRNGRELHLTATPARHGPVGIEPISGDVVGFAIGIDAPGDAIYVSGDTVWYEGVAEVARRFRPRLIVLFTGAARPRGPFHVTMDSNDAIEAAHAFADARIVAIHNHGWRHFTESQADIGRAFDVLGLASRLQVLTPGSTIRMTL
jgi:L-ascorbate metabolism protein UlaG (beta-lactamase superfamily)